MSAESEPGAAAPATGERETALRDAMRACDEARRSKPWGEHIAYVECVSAIGRLLRAGAPGRAAPTDEAYKQAALWAHVSGLSYALSVLSEKYSREEAVELIRARYEQFSARAALRSAPPGEASST